MEVLTSLDEVKTLNKPIALTIGMFDGMHLGHQKIFMKLKELTHQKQGSIVVISFSNHPVEQVKSNVTVPKIYTIDEKLNYFKEHGANLVLLLKFNEKLKELSYDQFLKMIKNKIDFDFLVLGEGAKFGKDQKGDQTHVENLSRQLNFEAFYLDKIVVEDSVISSQRVRKQLKLGDVENIHKLLGRNYTLYAPFQVEKLKKTGDNILKITFDFDNHCQIPSGHYLVNLKSDGQETKALAYLTILGREKESNMFDLEIYMKGSMSNYMNDKVKIEFLKMLESEDELKAAFNHNSKIEKLRTDEMS